MSRVALAAAATPLTLIVLLAAAAAAVTSILGQGGAGAGCHNQPQPGTAVARLDPEQTTNAATIISVGQNLRVPSRGWVIALATALQESGLRNLPHLGEDNDHDSLGLFQQRPSTGWGTPEQIMDPVHAATAFYARLQQVPGWEDLPLTEAAQAVQRSAHPRAYARHEARANQIVAAAALAGGGSLPCAPGGWARPLAGEVVSGFRTANRPDHHGIDIPAAPGAPVVAAAAGTVTVATCQATIDGQPTSCDVDGGPRVSGCGWYIDVVHSSGVVTRYCHLLRRPEVSVGEQVSLGQTIGRVGSSGNSSGPHLHLEVELRTELDRDAAGVTVERRQTDPVAFFAGRGIDFDCPGSASDCRPVRGDRVRIEPR